ncbi:hypothetical protein TIFTF001_028246 [Ficus carica]|uniref:peptidylprolyl isomerase n=1 Tax=Ficus carica TaxID=3494 RepID=A0AA88IWA6_FICCA|nr:hypothetical protein TIFTF001_028246 [Ficus carica]
MGGCRGRGAWGGGRTGQAGGLGVGGGGREEKERGRERGGLPAAEAGAGGRGAGGESSRERGEERERGREREKITDDDGRAGAGCGSPASVAGGGKIADDGEDFGWEVLCEKKEHPLGAFLQRFLGIWKLFHLKACSNFNSHVLSDLQVVAENKKHRIRPLTVKRFPRRVFLQFMGFFKFNSLLFLSEPASVSAAPLPDMNDSPEVIRTLKLPSGVRIQEILEGEGEEAKEGNTVQINYVCRRSNGYFVHSTVDQFSGESSPVILPLDENRIIRGLKEVLIGMRVGGKRRALIPPSVGYVNENLKPIPEEFGPRRSLLSHAKEPLIFEVQLLKLL